MEFDPQSYYGVINPYYQQLFGRQVAQPGLEYWANELYSGRLTEDRLRDALIGAASPEDLAYYNQYVLGMGGGTGTGTGGGGVTGGNIGDGSIGIGGTTVSPTTNVGPGAQSPGVSMSTTGQTGGISSNRVRTTYDYSNPITYNYTTPFNDPTYNAYNTNMYDFAPLAGLLQHLGYLTPSGEGQQLTEYQGGNIQDPSTSFTPMTAKGGTPPPQNATYGKGGKGGMR